MEDLKNIYDKAMQYCVAMYDYEADELHLLEDGSFRAVYYKMQHSGHYEQVYDFDAIWINEDLESIHKKRKQIEAQSNDVREIEYQRRQQEVIEAERKQRKEQYLKLKKEFEQD